MYSTHFRNSRMKKKITRSEFANAIGTDAGAIDIGTSFRGDKDSLKITYAFLISEEKKLKKEFDLEDLKKEFAKNEELSKFYKTETKKGTLEYIEKMEYKELFLDENGNINKKEMLKERKELHALKRNLEKEGKEKNIARCRLLHYRIRYINEFLEEIKGV